MLARRSNGTCPRCCQQCSQSRRRCGRRCRTSLGNAIKYGGRAPWVRVSAREARTRRGRQVQIVVEDRGPGIPPADLPHIFEPFYRGAEAQSQQIHGNGLGLSIVRSIVEAHGGRVTVTSAPGKGSTFTMHLPVAKGETAADTPALQVADGHRRG